MWYLSLINKKKTYQRLRTKLWWVIADISGLEQDCGSSIANAMELPQSCSKPLIFFHHKYQKKSPIWKLNYIIMVEPYVISPTYSLPWLPASLGTGSCQLTSLINLGSIVLSYLIILVILLLMLCGVICTSIGVDSLSVVAFYDWLKGLLCDLYWI